MAGLMLIRPSVSGEWTWVTSADDQGAAERGSPSDAAQRAQGHRVILLVPGMDVSIMLADVPTRSRRTAVAAIPWALEERLIDDIENLHFAVGARTPDGRWPVAVIARPAVDTLLAQCAEIGLEPNVLLPEPLALPVPGDNTWVVLEEADRFTLRSGDNDGLACEPEMLSTLLGGAEPPGELVRYRAADAPADVWPESFDAVVGQSEPIDCPEPLAALPEAWSPRINLLQGAYAPGSRYREHLRQWLLPAGLAACVAALALVHSTVEHFNLVAREAELREQMERIYKETFPDAQRIVDPRAQMEGRIDALQGKDGNAGFLEVAGRIARPLAGREDVQLTELQWRDGMLDLTLRTDRLERMDRVQQELQQAGFTAELRGVERNENRVTGRLRLQGAEP